MSRTPHGPRDARLRRRLRPVVTRLEGRELLAATIADPGFEAALVDTGAGGYSYQPAGSAWQFSGTAGVAGNGSAFTYANPAAPEGVQVGFIQQFGTISQTVPDWDAGTYQLTLQAAQRLGANYYENFQLIIDGDVITTFTPSSSNYKAYTSPIFEVAAGTHTISFQGMNSAGGDDTALIDAVNLTPVVTTAPVIKDPGFESLPIGIGQYIYLPSPGTSPWTYSEDSGIAAGGAPGLAANGSAFTNGVEAPDGVQVAFIQQHGTIAQSIANWAAGSYRLSFDAAQRSYLVPSNEDFEVLLDGNVIGTFDPTSTDYQTYTTDPFDATAGTHTLTFEGLDTAGGDNTVLIDAVQLTNASDANGSAPTPVITSPASATPTDVVSTTTELSVGATVEGDASDLTYSWSVESKPEGAFDPQLSDNDSNTASDVTATFTSAGVYTFLVTVDNDGSSVSSEVTVTVDQVAAKLEASPPSAALSLGEGIDFSSTLLDQFGHVIQPTVSARWSILAGLGTIQDSGHFAAGLIPGEVMLQVASGGLTAVVLVQTTDLMAYTGDVNLSLTNLPNRSIVTDQFPEVTFSGDPDYPNYATSGGIAAAGTDTVTVSGITYHTDPYNHPLDMDFTVPVGLLSFTASPAYVYGTDESQSDSFDLNEYLDDGTVVTQHYSTPYPSQVNVILRPSAGIARVLIDNVSGPQGFTYGNFRYVVDQVNLTAHRTGDFQGQVVPHYASYDSFEPKDYFTANSANSYTVLVDDDHTLTDGIPALLATTADIPLSGGATTASPSALSGSGNEPDADLAQITLNQLGWSGGSSKVKLVLSDPSAVRLFRSDGSLLYQDGVTGDDALTLDMSNPTGYLAGLLTGNVDVWLQAVHPCTDFKLSIVAEDDQGRFVTGFSVDMTLADWTYRSEDGTPVDSVEPIWESALLAELQTADALNTTGQVNEGAGDYFFKNEVDGLADDSTVNLQVTSDDEPDDTFSDDLTQLPGQFVSPDFAALYGSEEILDADPDPDLTADQRDQILSVLGLNVVHNPAATETLVAGPDEFTRQLTIRKDFTITVQDGDDVTPADGIFNVGDHIKGSVTADDPEAWAFIIRLIDANGKIVSTSNGSGPTNFDFTVNALGYYTIAVAGIDATTMLQTQLVYNNPALGLQGLPFTPNNSILVRVLPAGQTLNDWELQAWRSLQGSGAVPGDPVNRVRRITELYAQMYNDRSPTVIDPNGGSVFKWAGMASLATQLIGGGLAKAQAVSNNQLFSLSSNLPKIPDTARGIQLLARGNLDVFMDMYPQMLAYRSGGISAIQQLLGNNPAKQFQLNAWTKIAQGQQTGNEELIWQGNQDLLEYEQRVTLQNGAYADDPAYFQKITDTQIPFTNVQIPEIPALDSPIPGDPSTFQTFRATPGVVDVNGNPIAPMVSIGDFDARWAWIVQDQLPKYRSWATGNPLIDIKTLLSGGYKSF